MTSTLTGDTQEEMHRKEKTEAETREMCLQRPKSPGMPIVSRSLKTQGLPRVCEGRVALPTP